MVNILEVLVLLPRIYAGDAMLFNNPASPAEQENVLLIYVLTIFPGKKHTYFSREQRHHPFSRNSWEGRIRTSYSGIGPTIQAIKYINTEKFLNIQGSLS